MLLCAKHCASSLGRGHGDSGKRQEGRGIRERIRHFLFLCKFSLAGDQFSLAGDQFSSVQSLSCVQLFVTPWTAAYQASLSFTNSWSLLKLMSIESVVPSSHLFLCHPFLLLPSIFPSIRVFSKESVLHIRWPKYWSFSFSFCISPSNEYSGSTFDWFLFVIQGTVESLPQHHSLKASILQCSAFFIAQLSTTTQLHSFHMLAG